MNSLKNQKICLKEFMPEKVLCGRDCNKKYDLKTIDNELNFILEYRVDLHNQTGLVGKRKFGLSLPKYINKNQETFEVLGLLQAEMGKRHDGKIVFCNHEYQIINKVIKWFDKELNFKKDDWKWYIKINIQEPLDPTYKKEVECKIIKHWTKKVGLSMKRAYPKRVSYIKNTKNRELKCDDYGCLIIERRANLFSQIIKNMVKDVSHSIVQYEQELIKGFMKGIIAGEACIEIDGLIGKFRVHISTNDENEKLIYYNCLKKLGIDSIIYKHDKLVISKKENNLKLLKQNLMILSNEKHNKFLKMMSLYKNLNI